MVLCLQVAPVYLAAPMRDAYDRIFTRWDAERAAVVVTWGRAAGKGMTEEAELYVRYDRDEGGRPTRVAEVGLVGQHLTPTELQRFPWRRWMDVADAIARSGGKDYRKVRPAVRKDKGLPPARPGRAGHDRSHYERVAQRYEQLRQAGNVSNPTAKIADEWGYSRNTVAGWVRRCRELELLPPGRRGRAG